MCCFTSILSKKLNFFFNFQPFHSNLPPKPTATGVTPRATSAAPRPNPLRRSPPRCQGKRPRCQGALRRLATRHPATPPLPPARTTSTRFGTRPGWATITGPITREVLVRPIRAREATVQPIRSLPAFYLLLMGFSVLECLRGSSTLMRLVLV